MEPISHLEQHLRDASTKGHLDSEGVFTVDGVKAWEKLGKFQLPFPEAWVLKFVQAAQAHEGCILNYRTHTDEVRFSFRNFQPLPDWNHQAFARELFATGSQSNEVLSHLVVGVRALAQLENRNFSLIYPDGSRFTWNDGEFVVGESEASVKCDFVVQVSTTPNSDTMFGALLKKREHHNYVRSLEQTLKTFCRLHDGRVLLNDQAFGGVAFDPFMNLKNGSSTPEYSCTVAVVKCPPTPGLPTMVSNPLDEKTRDPVVSQYYSIVPISTPTQVLREFSVAVGLSLFVSPRSRFQQNQEAKDIPWYGFQAVQWTQRKDSSEILWAKRGVVVARDELRIKANVGASIVISAEGLETDVSGLTLRANEAKEKRLHSGLEAVTDQLYDFVKDEPHYIGAGCRKLWKLNIALVSCSCGFLLVDPVLGVMAGLATSVSLVTPKSISKKVKKSTSESFLRVVEGIDRVRRELHDNSLDATK